MKNNLNRNTNFKKYISMFIWTWNTVICFCLLKIFSYITIEQTYQIAIGAIVYMIIVLILFPLNEVFLIVDVYFLLTVVGDYWYEHLFILSCEQLFSFCIFFENGGAANNIFFLDKASATILSFSFLCLMMYGKDSMNSTHLARCLCSLIVLSDISKLHDQNVW